MKRAKKQYVLPVGRFLWPAAIIVAAVVVFFSAPFLYARLQDVTEDIAFRLNPTAERAYEYGERHFDGQQVHAYDLVRAEYFFREALRLDPSLRYVHHEMARIYFLKGDFWDALSQINIQIKEHGDDTPNSYYVRGLIEGYMGDYASSATDYEHFLQFNPRNWAAINDYAWVLLKAERFQDAANATEKGLTYAPNNPWLLNSSAIALFELGDLQTARMRAQKAESFVQNVSEAQWLSSYPGNDPSIAQQGISTFRTAVDDNMHRIELALASSTVQ